MTLNNQDLGKMSQAERLDYWRTLAYNRGTTIATHQDSIDKMQERVDILIKQRDYEWNKIDNIPGINDNFKLASFSGAVESVIRERDTARRRIKELEEGIEELHQELADCNTISGGLKTSYWQMRDRAEKAEREIEQLKRGRQAAKQRASDNADRAEKAIYALTNLQRDFEHQSKELGQAKRDTAHERYHDTKNHAERAEQECDEIRTTLHQVCDAHDNLITESAGRECALRKELADTQMELLRVNTREIPFLHAEIEQLKEDHDSVWEDLVDAKADLVDAEAKEK